jgi:exosortase/archaeosortase family protein
LIDDNTSNAQILSTKGAYYLLDIAGFQPHMQQSFLIFLDNYQLNVGVACSGMKLTLALIATVIFILLVAKLKWWANLILVAVAIPLALAINSLRIALIGILGETIGPDAGTWMHDYGSYGTLLLAFWLLYILAKKLGWKV